MMSYAALLIFAATITAVCLVGPALSNGLTEKATKLGKRIKASGTPLTIDRNTATSGFVGKITSLSVEETEIFAKVSAERITCGKDKFLQQQKLRYYEPKPFTVTLPLPDAATCNVKAEFNIDSGISQGLQNVFGAAVKRKILDEAP